MAQLVREVVGEAMGRLGARGEQGDRVARAVQPGGDAASRPAQRHPDAEPPRVEADEGLGGPQRRRAGRRAGLRCALAARLTGRAAARHHGQRGERGGECGGERGPALHESPRAGAGLVALRASARPRRSSLSRASVSTAICVARTREMVTRTSA